MRYTVDTAMRLNLDLCWEYGILRCYDPVSGSYLRTYDETDDERIAEAQRADAAERRSERERDGRLAEAQLADAAEARAAQLEAELRRLQSD